MKKFIGELKISKVSGITYLILSHNTALATMIGIKWLSASQYIIIYPHNIEIFE